MSESYTPKVGDRVRVTYEGEVLGITGRAYFTIGINGHSKIVSSLAKSIEKLVDPEPEWVNGDLVEAELEHDGRRVVVRYRGKWLDVDNGRQMGPYFMSNNWPDNIKILYKADGRSLSPSDGSSKSSGVQADGEAA